MYLIQLTTHMADDTKPIWINPMNVVSITIANTTMDTLISCTGGSTIAVTETVGGVIRAIDSALNSLNSVRRG